MLLRLHGYDGLKAIYRWGAWPAAYVVYVCCS
jgi:hypothetical protein